jgi:hypothetical protein
LQSNRLFLESALDEHEGFACGVAARDTHIRKSITSAQIFRLPGAPTFWSARSARGHKSRQ